MAKISKHIIDRLLEASDIVDVVVSLIGWYDRNTNPCGLKKMGVRYTALCPFPKDRNAGNFIVYPKKQCYKCFACGAKGGVIDFLMNYAKLSYPNALRYLGKKYDIEVDDVDMNYTPPPARPAPPPLPMLVLPMTMVTRREHTENNTLCNWLRSLPLDASQKRNLEESLKAYHVGTSRQGMTIWWQIDEQQRVRTGKMMLYKSDGHRDKSSRYNYDWIHAILFRTPEIEEYSDDKQEFCQTLFGMHLLDDYPGAAVHIVESEKTAVIMATLYGNNVDRIWMACGGVENLSREKLAPIIKERRRIIVYPDRDAITKWREKVNGIHYDRMTVNVQAVQDWWMPCDGEKADIADVVIRMTMEHAKAPVVSVGDMMKKNPAVRTLVEKFNLE